MCIYKCTRANNICFNTHTLRICIYCIYICYTHKLFWLVVWNIFLVSIMHGIILPIDFHIFQDGWSHQPVFISIYSTSSSLNLGSDPNVSRCGAQDLFGLRHAALRPLACRLSVGLHDPGASLWLLGFGEEIRKPYRMVPPSYKLVYKPH